MGAESDNVNSQIRGAADRQSDGPEPSGNANIAALPMPAYQRRMVESASRFTWNCWARQTGKSFTFSLRRLVRGLLRRRTQIFLSAGERQSREVMEKAYLHCQALKIAAEFRGDGYFRNTSYRQLEIRLPGGVRIIGLPANPLTARGFTGDVFLDEFAMHQEDEAVWAALYPSILRGRGELDVCSTPRGVKNLFARLRDNARFERTTVTLGQAIAEGLEADATELREAIGDELIWRQEMCCEFVDEATSFMPYELIRRCQEVRLSTTVDWLAMQRAGADVYVGVDVGRVRDMTAVWIVERGGELLETRGVLVMERASFEEQERVIGEVLGHRSVRRCCVDATGLGMQLAERLVRRFGSYRVEGMTFTAGLKSELAGRLRMLAETGRIRIPVEDAIERDWHSLTRVVSRSGHVRYEADRAAGGHADRFWAAALAAHAAARHVGCGDGEYLTGGAARFARQGVW